MFRPSKIDVSTFGDRGVDLQRIDVSTVVDQCFAFRRLRCQSSKIDAIIIAVNGRAGPLETVWPVQLSLEHFSG